MNELAQIARGPNRLRASYQLESESLQLLIERIARIGLIICLIAIYSGAAQFIFIASEKLLYGFYLIIIILTGLCIATDRQSSWGIQSIAVYLYWFSCYVVWGLLVTASPNSQLLADMIRMVFRNYLIIIAVVVGLNNLRSFMIFNYLVQAAIIINCAVSLWQVNNPQMITDLAYARNPTGDAFNVLRPAGIWINPDEAAFAFLFAFLIAFKGRGFFFVLARLAGITGIYLSASRTGMYILVLYALIALLFVLKSVRLSRGRIVALVCTSSLLLSLLLLMPFSANKPEVNLSDNLTVGRILDFSESAYATDYTRTDVTMAVFNAVMQSPIQGHGLFVFQRPDLFLPIHLFNTAFRRINNGAHNIYLVVWGETGIGVFLGYLLVLGFGVLGVFRAKIAPGERLIAGLLWLTYLIMGFTWHIQFTYMLGIVFIALIYHFPWVVAHNDANNTASLVSTPKYK